MVALKVQLKLPLTDTARFTTFMKDVMKYKPAVITGLVKYASIDGIAHFENM